MLEPRQVREAGFLKDGVKRRYRAEASEFAEQAALTIEQLIADNNSVKAENVSLGEKLAAASALADRYDSEKADLLGQLAEARSAVEAAQRREAENASAADRARAQAADIIRQAHNEQTAILNRADALITQKALTFEGELKTDVARWQDADRSLREFKKQLAELVAKLPDGVESGVGETAKNLWRRLCNSLQEARAGDAAPAEEAISASTAETAAEIAVEPIAEQPADKGAYEAPHLNLNIKEF